MTTPETPRTGARSRREIEPEILAALNAGEIESASLSEGLAVNFAELLAATVPDLAADQLQRMKDAATQGYTKRMKLAADILLEFPAAPNFSELAEHRSDTVRGWAAYHLAAQKNLSLADRLEQIEPLANDPHWAVREWAWIALRDHIAEDVAQSLKLFQPWTQHESENVRRFASEATRPRGVWCKHIPLLKEQPELGQPLLEALRADPSRYVQNSVANWLNDAGKDHPEWVLTLTDAWSKEDSPHTGYVVKRARRNLN